MSFATPALAAMSVLESKEPEMGIRCAIVGRETYLTADIYEIGRVGQTRMVRVKGVSTGHTRCFTERRDGRWIERGDAAKGGTPLVIGYPR